MDKSELRGVSATSPPVIAQGLHDVLRDKVPDGLSLRIKVGHSVNLMGTAVTLIITDDSDNETERIVDVDTCRPAEMIERCLDVLPGIINEAWSAGLSVEGGGYDREADYARANRLEAGLPELVSTPTREPVTLIDPLPTEGQRSDPTPTPKTSQLPTLREGSEVCSGCRFEPAKCICGLAEWAERESNA